MPAYELRINGAAAKVEVRDPDEPLLYVLRNRLGLTGAKFGCGLGQCGACTVIVDGDAVRSCTLSIARAVGKTIVTVGALGTGHCTAACSVPRRSARRSLLAFPEVPAIAIDLVVRPQEPPLGAGEAAATPVAAALANAVFDACGARPRTVPVTKSRVLEALA